MVPILYKYRDSGLEEGKENILLDLLYFKIEFLCHGFSLLSRYLKFF